MLDFNCYRMSPGYVCKTVFIYNQLSFYCKSNNKAAVGQFFLNVPISVIWEGEGEVSVSMPEQVPKGLVGREHVYIALHQRKKVKR